MDVRSPVEGAGDARALSRGSRSASWSRMLAVGTPHGPGAAARKPRLRGVIHQVAFFCSLPVAIALPAMAPSARAAIAVGVYGAAVSALFGVSALYHRVTWSPGRRRWMRRLDHSMIFVIIAASYTPFALLVLDGPLSRILFVFLWLATVAGVVLKLLWLEAPKWSTATVYAVTGSATLVALPELIDRLGPVGSGLLVTAGVLSAAGGLVYAVGRPNPRPASFGYHEVFHVLVTVAIAMVYAVVAIYALDAPA